ncbi:hypothetical protein roselon_01730 [Roseibacterium elongatum DSM 19469]|uniref:Uncharacterized protein n=1 Tax=Roseicyclus elongatus DSM 19469 TaxID=1294273 RepID=W8S1P8_9RHOB|nr:hypothetical protein roselon_01730 [Roseibacterium elongatum DSM 19469]
MKRPDGGEVNHPRMRKPLPKPRCGRHFSNRRYRLRTGI